MESEKRRYVRVPFLSVFCAEEENVEPHNEVFRIIDISLGGIGATSHMQFDKGQYIKGFCRFDGEWIPATLRIAWQKQDGKRYAFGCEIVNPSRLLQNAIKKEVLKGQLLFAK